LNVTLKHHSNKLRRGKPRRIPTLRYATRLEKFDSPPFISRQGGRGGVFCQLNKLFLLKTPAKARGFEYESKKEDVIATCSFLPI